MSNQEFKNGQEVWTKAIVANPKLDSEGYINLKLEDGLGFWVKSEEIMTEMPEKTEIPKFVADWIEIHKKSFSDTSAIDMYDNLTLDNSNGYYHDVWLWVIANHYDFIKAWHVGYEVEKEQMYTVVIPNPNIDNILATVLKRTEDNTIELCVLSQPDFSMEKFQLTEAEIKQDFEWAFQFAKPVCQRRRKIKAR